MKAWIALRYAICMWLAIGVTADIAQDKWPSAIATAVCLIGILWQIESDRERK